MFIDLAMRVDFWIHATKSDTHWAFDINVHPCSWDAAQYFIQTSCKLAGCDRIVLLCLLPSATSRSSVDM